MGTVYLIHFETKYRHAGHYLGYSNHIMDRLAAHATGNGARLMEVIADAGIGWTLARTWRGNWALESRLKRWHGSVKLCPICKGRGATPAAKALATRVRRRLEERKRPAPVPIYAYDEESDDD